MQSLVTKQDVILIIDDDNNNLKLLSEILTKRGYKVLIAQNGINGLETAFKVIPDLILLDINMPQMSGLEVCQGLKSHVLTQNTPIIFITGLSKIESKVRGFNLGAVDYITKPIEEAEVLARINIHLTIQNLQQTLLQKNQQLEKQIREEQLFTKISEHIRSSLELSEIWSQVSQDIQKILNCDRVLITKVTANHTSLEAQAVGQKVKKIKAQTSNWQTLYANPAEYLQYQEGYCHSFSNVNIWKESELNRLYEQWDIKAELVMPIWLDTNQPIQKIKQEEYPIIAESWQSYGKQENTAKNSNNLSFLSFWGYVIIHQCDAPRQWQESEIHLLQRLSTQLSIAIKQALFYQDLKTANAELQKLAVQDTLTQVFNRRYFEQQISLEWRRLTRNATPLSLIMCDVDHFKIYNDTYGHQQGDECLRQVAAAISACIRRPADVVCRYGGEEFAVILPDTHQEGAVKVAESINNQVQSLNLEHINSPTNSIVTISLGVACTIPNRDSKVESLIHHADRALYMAKSQGRNGLAVYQPNLSS